MPKVWTMLMSKGMVRTADTQASKAAKEWCAQAIPYMEYLQQQEKYYIEKVHELLCDDLYSALPELKPMSGPLRTEKGHRSFDSFSNTRLDHPGSRKC